MIKIKECCEKYDISPTKIEKHPLYIILYTKEKTYLLKEKDSSKKELFSYLESIHYPYYHSPQNELEDSYELYEYEEEKMDSQTKGHEIMKALGLLHQKTMITQDIEEEDRKEQYEKINGKIEEIRRYYQSLQEYIEQFSFPRVDYYYLINNISMFYQILFLSKNLLEEWYQLKPGKRRIALVLHNGSLKNYHKDYFIDFSKCEKDDIIEDFLSTYQKEVGNLNMIELFSTYEKINPLTKEEKKLLFSLICIPEKIDFSSNIYKNTVEIQKKIAKIHETFLFLSEKNKENQKTDKKEFQEENENIKFSSNEEQN